ncbi:hypothetical protein M9Y10_019784 [Tritrichomonas musculus]|uniref:Protein kinase domain-containing protein n=1 Tax=Tritrichomonas musculus TaxID=1915356 RepID=A0ABR2HH93_9EUKA
MNELHLFSQLTAKFTINTSSKFLFGSDFFSLKPINEIITEIGSYPKNTGIMIGNVSIAESTFLYLLVFDYHIIIIDHFHIHLFDHSVCDPSGEKKIFFLNSQCEKEFQALRTKKYDDSSDSLIKGNQTNLSQKIKKQIVNCIIKKSQIRTQNREIWPNDEFNYNDFVSILNFNQSVKLCFNVDDQFLYILKFFDMNNEDSKRNYKNEITIYIQNNNFHNYIPKYFGEIKFNDLMIIVIEYIEGQTLDKFIENGQNKVNYFDKIKIILDIMITVEYLHLNHILIRDLKSNNIIIDSKNDAFLIDFDRAKQINSNEIVSDDTGDQMTGDIGTLIFASPEQYLQNKYSFKSDVYSLGIIIYFILTDKMFPEKLKLKSLNLKENILNFVNSVLCPSMFKEIYQQNKENLEYYADKRPSISSLFNKIFLIMAENEKNKIFLKEIIKIREKQYVKYCKNRTMFEDISNFLGFVYYEGKFIEKDIKKSIFYFTISTEPTNDKIQHILGKIFYEEESIAVNIKKAIHYLTLSSNQGNSRSQSLLGEIYYLGKYCRVDIEKAIYYLELTSNNGDKLSQYMLAEIYCFGQYCPRNIEK